MFYISFLWYSSYVICFELDAYLNGEGRVADQGKSYTIALSFSISVSFAPISQSNTPDALTSYDFFFTKRYEGKIKTTRRHAGKYSSYLGNKIDDRGLHENHINFDKLSLDDLAHGDGSITYDVLTYVIW